MSSGPFRWPFRFIFASVGLHASKTTTPMIIHGIGSMLASCLALECHDGSYFLKCETLSSVLLIYDDYLRA